MEALEAGARRAGRTVDDADRFPRSPHPLRKRKIFRAGVGGWYWWILGGRCHRITNRTQDKLIFPSEEVYSDASIVDSYLESPILSHRKAR